MTRQSQVRWSQVRVGLLVVVALSLLVIIIMNLEQGLGMASLSKLARFHAIVPHTQGLKVGGPVRMNGVDVGNVREIQLAEDSPNVDILFTVKSTAARHVHEDALARIRPMGLLGDKFLEIVPGSAARPLLPSGGTIPGEAEPDFAGLAEGVTATMEQLNGAIRQVQHLLSNLTQGEGTAGRLLSDPALYTRSQRVLEALDAASGKGLALLDKLERGEGTLGQLLADGQIYTRANQAVQELNTLAARLNNQNGTLAKLSDPALYQRLEGLAQRGDELMNRIERGDGTIGKLITRDELYVRTDKLLSEVEMLVTDIKRNPTRYFKFSVF